MPSNESKSIVVDASVASSSGEQGERGEKCQGFLRTMRDETEHRVVITKEIGLEWDKYSHPFARTWRRSMNAKRRVDRPMVKPDGALRSKIERITSAEKSLVAMEKDLRLIEAAKATDNRIVSLDETARKLFAVTSSSIGELKDIIWVNPVNCSEKPVDWLKNNAPVEISRLLRSFPC